MTFQNSLSSHSSAQGIADGPSQYGLGKLSYCGVAHLRPRKKVRNSKVAKYGRNGFTKTTQVFWSKPKLVGLQIDSSTPWIGTIDLV